MNYFKPSYLVKPQYVLFDLGVTKEHRPYYDRFPFKPLSKGKKVTWIIFIVYGTDRHMLGIVAGSLLC